MGDEARAVSNRRAAPPPPAEHAVVSAMTELESFARLWSSDWPSAQDLLRQPAERALRSIDQYRPGSSAVAWLRTIMYRLAIDETRRMQRYRQFRAGYAVETEPATTSFELPEEDERSAR